jgi:hypothetical protein
LAQQGTIKRRIRADDFHQSICLGLMHKIDRDGLAVLIEHLQESTNIEIDAVQQLLDVLTLINQYLQRQTSVSIEDLLNQLSSILSLLVSNEKINMSSFLL